MDRATVCLGDCKRGRQAEPDAFLGLNLLGSGSNDSAHRMLLHTHSISAGILSTSTLAGGTGAGHGVVIGYADKS